MSFQQMLEDQGPLTAVEKIVIRFIQTLKFKNALRKFHVSFEPYDTKDVIDQYTAGNTDMCNKLKKNEAKLRTRVFWRYHRPKRWCLFFKCRTALCTANRAYFYPFLLPTP